MAPKSNLTPVKLPDVATDLGKKTQNIVTSVLESVDQIFFGLMGDLGRTVYASIQDAIALSILLQVPSTIAKVIINKDFASYDVCLKENPLGASCLACFIIVTSDYLLWVVLAGRVIARFWTDIKNLHN
jgi:hypothetical protein